MESIYNYIYCCLDKPTDILRPVGSVCRDIHILLIFCYVLRSRSMPVKTTLKSDFFFISCVREVGMSKSPLIRLFVLQWSILVFIWYLLKKKKIIFLLCFAFEKYTCQKGPQIRLFVSQWSSYGPYLIFI